MKGSSKKRFFLMLLVAVILAVSSTAFAADKSAVNWFTYSEGIEKIKSEKKLGYLYFFTDWCAYCKMMDDQTFTDKAVGDYLNENFIPIRVDAEREKSVAGEYGANRFPSNWFLTEDAQTIANRPGFIPPDQMLHMLKYLHSGSYKTLSFSEFLEKQE